jgi:DNA-binding GntR family transcriptional regulator
MKRPLPAIPSSNVEKACQVIREAVQSGRFAGGEWIREVTVAEMAKVSRTSVRQALTMLAAEGYVELRPNRGAVVVDWTEANLLQIFDLRALLESYGCALAARHATREELAGMREEANEFSRLVKRKGVLDVRQIAESNNRLHRLFLAAGRNPRLASLLVAVVQVPLVKQTFGKYDHDALLRSAAQHHELVDAIGSGDAAWAEATMRSHIHAAKRVIFGETLARGAVGPGGEDR